jgi:hypothetical protein
MLIIGFMGFGAASGLVRCLTEISDFKWYQKKIRECHVGTFVQFLRSYALSHTYLVILSDS